MKKQYIYLLVKELIGALRVDTCTKFVQQKQSHGLNLKKSSISIQVPNTGDLIGPERNSCPIRIQACN